MKPSNVNSRRPRRTRRPNTKGRSGLENSFALLWSQHPRSREHEALSEFKFDPNRQWRFDFAWPDAKVAVELEGGTFSKRSQSRHTTATGHQGDCEKYNAAAIAGWCVLRYTAQDMQRQPLQIIEQIVGVIEGRLAE